MRIRFSRAGFSLLVACAGCAQIFDIERGTFPSDDDAGASGDSGSPPEGGTGGARGGMGGSGGRTGGAGGSAGSNGASGGTSSGGNGGTQATGGNAGNAGGSGVSGKGGSSGSAGACDCSVGSTSDALLISNFENRGTALLNHAERTGGFYTYASPDSAITEAPMVECTENDGNCYVLCVSGELAGSGYPYATLGASLRVSGGKASPYDASEYSGISFRIRGSVGQSSTLRAGFSTRATMEADDYNDGACMPTATLDCGDPFVTPVALSSSFQTRAYRFFELGQGNGGGQWSFPWGVPASWDPESLINIEWKVNSTVESLKQPEPFEFCIDDVAFLPALTATQTIDFETTVGGFAPIAFAASGASLSLSSAQHSGGVQSLELLMAATTEPTCAGTPTPCAELGRDECWSPGCGYDTPSSSCAGTPTPCAQAGAPCPAGCTWNHLYSFGVDDPDMQPGDTVTFRYHLPSGMLHWVQAFVADANSDWTTLTNIDSFSKREQWLTGGFTIPEDCEACSNCSGCFLGPVRQFGFQVAATPAVASGFYVDDVSW
jgi:hypothetical protein